MSKGRLVIGDVSARVAAMSRFAGWIVVVFLALGFGTFADELRLKGQGAISGKILSEKEDVVAIDVGYTVLVIPREKIEKIVRTKGTAKPAAPAAMMVKGLYSMSAKAPPKQTVRELVKVVGEAVVQVKTSGGLGSGFIIHEDGYLITNFHVIENDAKISVEVYHQGERQLERKTYRKVRIIAMNKFADLALLRIMDKDAPKFKTVPLAREQALAVGERVFAVGSPQGLERTVTEGIVSTGMRQVSGALYLQTSTPINPGNSGGPLFNLHGEVVGVTNMKLLASEGLGFAIPTDAVKFFLKNRDSFAYNNDNPGNAFRYLPPPRRSKTPTTP